jgi:tetratricopeptide (TPR) repeat protein
LCLLPQLAFGEGEGRAAALNRAAAGHRKMGQYGEAERLYKQSLSAIEAALGQEDIEFAVTLNNLALVYLDQGRYAEAESGFRRALPLLERILAPEHPVRIAAVSNLGLLLFKTERYSEAESVYRHVLAAREKLPGASHSDVGQTLNDLATVFIPMAGNIKTILNIVVVVGVAIWILQALGMWGRITSYKF